MGATDAGDCISVGTLGKWQIKIDDNRWTILFEGWWCLIFVCTWLYLWCLVCGLLNCCHWRSLILLIIITTTIIIHATPQNQLCIVKPYRQKCQPNGLKSYISGLPRLTMRQESPWEVPRHLGLNDGLPGFEPPKMPSKQTDFQEPKHPKQKLTAGTQKSMVCIYNYICVCGDGSPFSKRHFQVTC